MIEKESVHLDLLLSNTDLLICCDNLPSNITFLWNYQHSERCQSSKLIFLSLLSYKYSHFSKQLCELASKND